PPFENHRGASDPCPHRQHQGLIRGGEPIRWLLGATHNSGAYFCAANTMLASASLAALETTTRIQEEPMKPLSEQLSDLADRAKQAEDTVAAAQAKNRAALQSQ